MVYPFKKKPILYIYIYIHLYMHDKKVAAKHFPEHDSETSESFDQFWREKSLPSGPGAQPATPPSSSSRPAVLRDDKKGNLQTFHSIMILPCYSIFRKVCFLFNLSSKNHLAKMNRTSMGYWGLELLNLQEPSLGNMGKKPSHLDNILHVFQ